MRKLNKVFAGFFVAIAFMLLLTVKSAAVVDQAIVTDEVKNITFDANYYLSTYSDLKEAFGADSTAAYNHFLNFGISEGRCAKLTFDVVYYLNSNQDLKEAFGTDYEAAYKHFIEFGASEGRSGCLIYNTAYYLSNNTDVGSVFGKNYTKVYEHYANYGVNEGRFANSNFNVRCYINKYGDLKENFTGETKYAQGFAHYLTYGISEGRVGTHEYTTTTVEATCTEDGYILEECGCGDAIETVLPATGHNMTKQEVVNATCTSKGNPEYWTCSNESCEGKYYADEDGEKELTADEIVTPILEHVSDDGVITKEPTCTEAGEKTYTCTIGGEVLNTDTIPALEHDMEKTEAKEPTCTETGNNEYYTCKTCGKVFTDEAGENETTVEAQILPVDVHVLMYVSAKEATCAEEGNVEHYKCTKCGATFSDDEAKEPLANVTTPKTEEHTWNDGEVTKVATCTEKGVKTYTCTVCGATKTEDIDMIAHDMEETEAKDATCTDAGNKAYYTCKNCDGIFEDVAGKVSTTVEAQTIAALGHSYGDMEVATGEEVDNTNNYVHKHTCKVCKNVEYLDEEHSWNDGEITTEPTCTEAGEKTYTCTVCGATKTEVVAALGHDYKLNAGERKTSTNPATCTENGYDEYLCSRCDKLKLTVAKATGHNMTEVAKVEATCTEDGHEAYYTCSNSCCEGKYFSDEEGTEVALDDLKITALGHNYKKEITTPATCGVAGEKTLTCSVCGDAKTETIEALEHDMTKHEAVDATCLTDGSKEYWTCSNECCEDKIFADESGTTETTLDDLKIAASDEYHDWKDIEDVSTIGLKAPTCTEAGYSARQCETCGEIDVSDAEALGHEYGDAVLEASGSYAGYYKATCIRCSDAKYYTDSTKEHEVFGFKDQSTLKNSLEKAKDGDTLLLLDGKTVILPAGSGEEVAAFEIDKAITLDLGTGTLKSSSADSCALDISEDVTIKGNGKISFLHSILVENGATLTIDNVTMNVTADYGILVDDSKVVINGGTFTSYYSTLGTNNTYGPMDTTINGGTLTAKKGPAMYMSAANDKVTINDGTVDGILMRMGNLNVTGGIVNSEANTSEVDAIEEYYNYSGNVWLGDAIACMAGTYGDGTGSSNSNDLTINITGGTVNGKIDGCSAVTIYNLGKVAQNISVTISNNATITNSDTAIAPYRVVSASEIIPANASDLATYTAITNTVTENVPDNLKVASN